MPAPERREIVGIVPAIASAARHAADPELKRFSDQKRSTTQLRRHEPDQAPERDPVCYGARMSWISPTQLLLLASVVALLPLAALVRRPTSAPRLMAEAFVTALAVIAPVWLAWVAL